MDVSVLPNREPTWMDEPNPTPTLEEVEASLRTCGAACALEHLGDKLEYRTEMAGDEQRTNFVARFLAPSTSDTTPFLEIFATWGCSELEHRLLEFVIFPKLLSTSPLITRETVSVDTRSRSFTLLLRRCIDLGAGYTPDQLQRQLATTTRQTIELYEAIARDLSLAVAVYRQAVRDARPAAEFVQPSGEGERSERVDSRSGDDLAN